MSKLSCCSRDATNSSNHLVNSIRLSNPPFPFPPVLLSKDSRGLNSLGPHEQTPSCSLVIKAQGGGVSCSIYNLGRSMMTFAIDKAWRIIITLSEAKCYIRS